MNLRSRGATQPELREELNRISRPLRDARDLDPLLARIGDARYVLLGEASHGTSEYYRWRTLISQRLITEKGFTSIAVEGDWPDCEQVSRHVTGRSQARDARSVLGAFQRWPTWMWANEEVEALVAWLRAHNAARPGRERVTFHGLDVYSLWDSLAAAADYLRHDPQALAIAQRAEQCFEIHGGDVQQYALATLTLPVSCEDEVVALLGALRARARPTPGTDDADDRFDAEQNALVATNAERYYRAMIRGGPESWNIRDRHMVETLERVMQHRGPDAKAILWMHNTHIGDARFTDMAGEGMVNAGELVREAHAPADVVLVGFGSYEGSVIAARHWEAPARRMDVPRARAGSWEQVLHAHRAADQLLIMPDASTTSGLLDTRGHRAIGVVYRPEQEAGNYVPTVLARRYDAFLFLDRTQALRPLPAFAHADAEVPETWPTGK